MFYISFLQNDIINYFYNKIYAKIVSISFYTILDNNNNKWFNLCKIFSHVC